jgi:hypothetical protein
MQPACYVASIPQFLAESPEAILESLAHHAQTVDGLQRYAWEQQITLLKRELNGITSGVIAFEFIIPRMGMRIDRLNKRSYRCLPYLLGGSSRNKMAPHAKTPAQEKGPEEFPGLRHSDYGLA